MNKKKVVTRIASILLIISLFASSITFFTLFSTYKEIDFDVDERLFQSARKSSSTTYLAYNVRGELYEVFTSTDGGTKCWYDFDSISENAKKAFISAEDREFYKHSGVNYKRTVYAIFSYLINKLFSNKRSFGASTITQQVIKNISGDNEYSIKRKLQEILRAHKIEENHTKDEIFEMYLNIVPMTENIYGVGAASEYYFDKHPMSLELHEAALIVGITNSPRSFDPYVHPKESLEKRNNVLYAMLVNGAISELEYKDATEKPLSVLPKNERKSNISNWFVETAREDIVNDLMHKYGISSSAARLMLSSGAKIILTMDSRVQKILEDTFASLEERIMGEGKYCGAMVVCDSMTGDMLGVVGAIGEKSGERVLNYSDIKRPPGSVLKPLALYAPLIDEGKIHWSSIIEDSPVRVVKEGDEERPYPRNSPDLYEGNITVSKALARSKNTVAIRLYNMLGERKIFDILKNGYGFESIIERERRGGVYVSDLSEAPLALGQLTEGVSLREITSAYTVFPSDGVRKKGRSYLTVFDSSGNVLIENRSEEKRLMKKETARIMNMLLEGVVDEGTARSLSLKEYVDTAGKTGTSGQDKDRWFIGYTPYYTTGIWFGRQNGEGGIGNIGVSHLSVWDDVMLQIHESCAPDYYSETRSFSTEGLIYREFCDRTGLLKSDECTDGYESYNYGFYTKDNIPTEICKHPAESEIFEKEDSLTE